MCPRSAHLIDPKCSWNVVNKFYILFIKMVFRIFFLEVFFWISFTSIDFSPKNQNRFDFLSAISSDVVSSIRLKLTRDILSSPRGQSRACVQSSSDALLPTWTPSSHPLRHLIDIHGSPFFLILKKFKNFNTGIV